VSKSIKVKKNTKNVLLAIVFSASIHIAVGLILLPDLSNKSIFTGRLNHLNLFWVALETKNDAGPAATIPRPAAVLPPDASEIVPIQKTPVIGETGQGAAQIPEGTGLAGAVTLAGHGGSVKAVKEQTYNLSGVAAGETAGNLSAPGGTSAYPLYRENKPPVYPEIARIRGYEGIVLVAVEILPDGRVGNMKIRKSSGYAILDQSAVEAVKPWKFEPARKQGKPFAIWVELPIKFVLHDDNLQS
jgi:TonB family protein